MNDSLAARRRDLAEDAPTPANARTPADALSLTDAATANEQETASEETILEVLGESAAGLRVAGPGAGPVLADERLFGEVLIDTADDLLETLQRERAENWEFRFDDPARAAAADILEQLRSRTEALERICAACHGFLWHIRRAQELGVLVQGPAGALAPAAWFADQLQALAGSPRRSATGPVVRHPAWALIEVLERFRGADEVQQYLDRICAQSHGAVERLLAGQVLPLVQSLRAALASYSLPRVGRAAVPRDAA